MKTVMINEYGSNEVVTIAQVQIPEPKEGEVLVRITAAGVNPIDWKIRNGAGKRIGLELPIPLGGEIVGQIVKIGQSVTDFKVEDSVFGMVKVGGFSEYVCVPVGNISRKPNGLSDEEAAAIPLAGLTAWQGLFGNAQLQSGQKILITGASGAVGSLAVQFAKAKGATVVGLSSSKNADFVKSLGADEVIDYEAVKFEDKLQALDVVFDTVGGEVFNRAMTVLKPGGTIVSSVAFPAGDEQTKYGVIAKRVFCVPSSKELDQICELWQSGKLRARVSKTFPLDQVKEAFDLSETGQANGKLVLLM